jgi:DNA-directed RNA polymerase subunit beta'
MAILDSPVGAFRSLKDSVKTALTSQFPVEGKVNKLELVDLTIPDSDSPNSPYHIDNIEAQYKARTSGQTWGVPITAKFRLVAIATGKVLDEDSIMLARLPQITPRYSYIVQGSERQVDSIFRLKAGAYHTVADNGDIVAKWNLAQGRGLGGFNILLSDRDKEILVMRVGPKQTTTISLYSVLAALGISDAQIERAWGANALKNNKAKASPKDISKLMSVLEKRGRKGETPMDMLRQALQDSKIFPDAANITLGAPYENVTPENLLISSGKLLAISRDQQEPDDRQSLSSKTFHGVDDFVREEFDKKKWELKRRILNNLDRKSYVRDVVTAIPYNRTISDVFKAAELPTQINPLQFMSNHTKTTIYGQKFGGIARAHVNVDEDQLINPSHLGLLDPLQTPEDKEGTGITLHVPLGAKKEGNELKAQVWDVKKGEFVFKTAAELERAVVAYPDQVQFARQGGAIVVKPRTPDVVVYDADRATTKRPWKDVQYVLPSAKSLFSISTNLIPFVQNNNGNRAMMAAKHQEQALSLKEREVPLVQTRADGPATYSQIVGSLYSFRARVSGRVSKIEDGAIFVKGEDGKVVKHSIYNHYPLNGIKHMIHAEPTVKVGDVVKQGQLLADTNFSKDGHLALGRSLKVAYIPYKGYNFEDSIVISETAARKLTSVHLHHEQATVYPGMKVSRSLWQAYASPDKATGPRVAKLDENGVIRKGQKVEHGDILIGLLKPGEMLRERESLRIVGKAISDYVDAGVYWSHAASGVVADVVMHGKVINVYIRTEEPLEVGDKLSGTHGNKGVVGKILPDHEMPKNKKGEPMEVLLSPAGIPSRMNIGQVLEAAASKIARKTGKPYVISNFEADTDYTAKVKKDLADNGLSDTEELFDPQTGTSLGQILTGEPYVLKLDHQAEKKETARGIAGGYTAYGAPGSGSGIPGGGQKIGQLDTYALLAHGSKAFLREAQTYKSDVDQKDVWNKIMTGQPIPPPQIPRSMHMFTSYLKGAGVNVERKGDTWVLSPMTDAQTRGISNGELKMPQKTLMAKGQITKEEVRGLFDKKITGGLEGSFWSHIELPYKVPNPAFEHAIKSLLEMRDDEYEKLVGAELVNGKSGFDIIEDRLRAINVASELTKMESGLAKLKGSDLNKAYKKTRYLRALKELNLTPVQAYMNQAIPVVPPKVRPVKVGFDGKQIIADSNNLYANLGAMANEINRAERDKAVTPDLRHRYRADLYDAVTALRMNGMDQGTDRSYRSFMQILGGRGEGDESRRSPKESFFQAQVIGKRQDLSARSVIIPEPELSLDEVGVPRSIAMEMYKPFVIRELTTRMGASANPLDAMVKIKKNDPIAFEALERVVAERPVAMKRDPSLHKYSVMGAKVKLVDGKSIRVHPLVCAGFNADFDGDTMALYVPVSDEAVDEIRNMMPSKNLFSPAHGGLMPVPSQDAILGLFHATAWGVDTKKTAMPDQLIRDLLAARIKPSDIYTVNGRKTTAGRVLVDSTLPKEMSPMEREQLLHDPKFRLTKANVISLLAKIGKQYPEEYKDTADAFKLYGNKLAYRMGSSVSLNDFHDSRTLRDQILKKYLAEEEKIRKGAGTREQKDQKIIALYQQAPEELKKAGEAFYQTKGTNRMYDWIFAKAKGDWGNFSQMTMAPVLVTDPKNRYIPVPITKSFGEGLPVSQYWASLHGARKGTLDRAKGTQEPGAITKDIANTVINHRINAEDCGTTSGVFLPAMDNDVVDRYLAQDVTLKSGEIIRKNTILTAQVLSRIRNSAGAKIVVRSPLHCELPNGVCQKCAGLNERGADYKMGANIGVVSGHALGEPLTQLTMRTFHSGGAGTSAVTGAVDRLRDLLFVPKKIANSAILAKKSGPITDIQRRATGGWDVTVEKERHFIPAERKLLPTTVVGATVRAGDELSDGLVNPQELLQFSNSMSRVRNHLTETVHRTYTDNQIPVKRRNVETMVKAMTNIAFIEDPGSHPTLLRGQTAPLSEVEAYNRQARAAGKEPVEFKAELKPLSRVPLETSEDWIGRLNYQRLKETYLEGGAQNWKADIHGNVIAGIAHGAEFGLKDPF